ncbi:MULTISPECIES: lytic transglycosylase domain-containing protein [unclassified Ensifer]|uniref:lytic transglycosylase domain-containing protein n=1 Tax=unclassified Ensifer TaxID=2633371 RepID=UPI000813519B|nr:MULTISPECIES: lytic transglycosylase domain-containing protein [unclassified Ensifer]OCP09387.1 lytic transglycosylase [Ensifer sp. LC13]OCP10565.1 lytic transglycosylase [Ensifer sp. LC11]OCP11678.1 lytic transglycosylase [Ensifer sp. LC14]OCP32635.1 lytic transglycosylase [Ensifer sp. LC499]
MAKYRISLTKQTFGVAAILSATLVSGCSTVEHTSLEELTAVQTVTPLAKPGTEMTAYALPTPDGAATATSAALTAQTAAQASGVAVTYPVAADLAQGAKAAPALVAVPAAKPGDTMALAMVAPATQTNATAAIAAAEAPLSGDATQMAAAAPSPATAKSGRVQDLPISTLAVAAAMESDFDTGEPVGLETLVANRMIVPTERPKTGVIGSTVAAVASVIPDSMKFSKTPTSSRPELDKLIKYYADLNGIPVELVHRVVKRESNYNPRAYSKGNYGLMQIRYNTAKGLGYDGPAEGLFDAETNLKYATKYLHGAWMVADNKHDGAVKLYASGYYYHAKRKGLLEELGMK